jgi:hypothetical protein
MAYISRGNVPCRFGFLRSFTVVRKRSRTMSAGKAPVSPFPDKSMATTWLRSHFTPNTDAKKDCIVAVFGMGIVPFWRAATTSKILSQPFCWIHVVRPSRRPPVSRKSVANVNSSS